MFLSLDLDLDFDHIERNWDSRDTEEPHSIANDGVDDALAMRPASSNWRPAAG